MAIKFIRRPKIYQMAIKFIRRPKIYQMCVKIPNGYKNINFFHRKSSKIYPN
jgi:hypothetical protein